VPRKLTITTRLNDDARTTREVRRQIKEHMQFFKGKRVHIEIGPPSRSLDANAYYHGVIITNIHAAIISAGLGPVSHDALHAFFRDKYLPATVEQVFGEDKVMRPSTAKLNSTDFHYYVESIKTDEIVRQLDVHFPPPEGTLERYSLSEAQ